MSDINQSLVSEVIIKIDEPKKASDRAAYRKKILKQARIVSEKILTLKLKGLAGEC